MFRIIIVSLLLSLSTPVLCQETSKNLTLEETVNLALKNNLDLKSSELNSKSEKVIFKQSLADLLPQLNASYNAGINNGRSIDPYSNAYVDQQLSFSNAGLSLNATVFNGFELLNSLKRDRLKMKAAQAEVEEAKQDLILNVTLTFLQVLNDRDLVELAEARQETTLKQVDRLQTLYKQGSGNPADYTDIKGQLAADKANVITARNQYNTAILKLQQLLNIDFKITPQALDISEIPPKYQFSAAQVYQEALQNLSTFKAKELRIEAAKKDIGVSRALYIPDISLFAQLNTNYSSAARFFTQTGSQQVESGGFVTFNNQNFPVYVNQPEFKEGKISYNDQFSNNLNSVVGVEVSIPLLNGFRARHEVQLKKIQFEEAKVDLENTQSRFLESIKQAHSEMEAAYERYQVLNDQVAAFQESYRVNEIRFTNGVSNIVEYIISKNNLERAQINLANAKYEYLLRVKILEYYRGNS
ncbi:MAG: TolC family protein [Gillisia sp.]